MKYTRLIGFGYNSFQNAVFFKQQKNPLNYEFQGYLAILCSNITVLMLNEFQRYFNIDIASMISLNNDNFTIISFRLMYGYHIE